MITIRNSDFCIVSSSRNLRGIIDYSRRHIIDRVVRAELALECLEQLEGLTS